MAIHEKFLDKQKGGQCIRCGILNQTDPDFMADPELCTWCQSVIDQGQDADWKKGAFSNANHPKK